MLGTSADQITILYLNKNEKGLHKTFYQLVSGNLLKEIAWDIAHKRIILRVFTQKISKSLQQRYISSFQASNIMALQTACIQNYVPV